MALKRAGGLRIGSPRNVDGAALQDVLNLPNPVPGYLHQHIFLSSLVGVTWLLSITLWLVPCS